MKQFIKFFIALAAMTVSTASAWGQTKEITYLYCNPYSLDFSETSDNATKITSTSKSLSGYCYVEGNVTIDGTLFLSNHTYLILCDDSELTINSLNGHGFCADNNNLTIYAQSSGSHAGKLTIISHSEGIVDAIDFTINGGDIKITSTSDNGIECTDFYLNGGKVDIVGNNSTSVGIFYISSFTINGGFFSATGVNHGIYSPSADNVNINGGKVSVTGGNSGIDSGGPIMLGWTNAEDYIQASSYNKLPTSVSGKVFDIEGGGTFGGGAVVDKESLAGKKLTPNTGDPGDPVYTITLASGITGGTVEVNKVKAFAGERLAVNVTPNDGKILGSLSYTVGSDTYTIGTGTRDIKQQANDYVIPLPTITSNANVEVTATFVTPVAQIGDTKYASLAAALAAVNDGETITILSTTDESTTDYNFSTHGSSRSVTINMNSKTVSFGNISNKYSDLKIIGPGTINFGHFDNQGEFLFKDVTVNCKYIDNPGAAGTITFDNAKAVCNSGVAATPSLQLYGADQSLVLKNGSDVEIDQRIYVGYNDNFILDIQDAASILKLRNCVFGYMEKSYVEDEFLQYIRPDQKAGFSSDLASGNPVTFDLRSTWGIQLSNHLGKSVYYDDVERVTATFFDGGTSTTPPTKETFNLADYPEANAVVEIDNSDGKNHYVIVHLVPTENYAAGYYWTDPQLIRALDYGGALSRAGSPTIELGEKLTLLKRDTYDDNGTERTAYNGAGWYYYKLDKDHSVAKGYTESALEGFAPQRFILGESNVKQSSDLKTVTATNDGWSAEILFDPATLNYKFDGSERTPVITSITVKNGSNVMATLTDAEDIANQITVGSKHTIGNTPLELGAGMSWFDHNLNDASVAHFIISVPLSVADDSAPKGTSANPWLVKSAADMNLFSLCVNWGEYEFTNEWVKLKESITYDATTSAGFKPVGYSDYTYGKRFLGSFDGNYCVISGLEYVSDITIPHFVGLFGNVAKGDGANDVAPTIINLSLSECSFTGGNEYVRGCGALAGFLSNGTVKGVAVQGCTVTGSVKSPQSYVGGVVGAAELEARITDCAVDMNNDGDRRSEIINVITDASLGYSNCTGGIIGYAHTCEVDQCAVADATIRSVTPATNTPRDSYTGGVVGNSFVSNIHDNLVLRTTEIIDQIGSNGDNYVAAIIGFKGNAVGDGSGGTKLAHNYYDKAVTVSYKNSTMTTATTLNGYFKRGFRDIVIEEVGGVGTKTKDEYVDIVSEGSTVTDGAKMWVFPATIDLTAGDGRSLTFDKKTPGTDCYAIDATKTPAEYSYAPGDVITLTATYKQTVDDGRTFYDQLSISGEDGNGDAIVITPAAATLDEGTYTQGFSFEMPVEGAAVTATIAPSDWFTIDTNQKAWMSFYHEWTTDGGTSQTPVNANYTVSDPDGVKTIEALTITGVNLLRGSVTSGDLSGTSFSGMPTLFHCESGLPAKLKFTPSADAYTNVKAYENFKGTTVDKDMSGYTNLYVMNANGDFYYADITSTDKTLKAHRCYVALGNTAVVAPARLIVIGGEETGIGAPRMEGSDGDGRWFTIDGRRMEGRPQKKGIYINGGRKVVIK